MCRLVNKNKIRPDYFETDFNFIKTSLHLIFRNYIMKKIVVLLVLFVSILGFSQDKKISGYFTKKELTKNYVDTIVNIKNYNIYLLKDLNPDSRYKKILTSLNEKFEISISKKDAKKYYYLEFESENRGALYAINKTPNDTILIAKVGENLGDYSKYKIMVGKPAIYLYPKVKSEISVKNDFKGKVMNTYPLYKNGWNVMAEPNGVLLNLDDKRTYNYLFWDGSYAFTKKHYQYENGFYVKKEDNITFLQEKLEFLGLNNTEINDFVVYWLPELNKNEENFIHFWINDNIDNSSILTITPKPDTLLRVFMEFKAYNGEKKLPLQELTSTPRKGFTVVEWGGSNIDEPVLK